MADAFVTNEFGQVRKGDAAHSTATVAATTTLVVAANPDRLWLLLQNNGANPIFISIDEDDAVLNAGIALAVGEKLEFSAGRNGIYRGQVNGIVAASTEPLLVTEA